MKSRPINKIYKLHEQKIEYTTMPQYFIEGYQSGCYYEIYVNGFIMFKHYKNVGLMNHAVPINDVILKSGSQKVTIKLFPLGKIDDKEYTTIDADDSFRLKIFKRDKKQPYEAGDYDVVKEHYATLTDGLPYYEETFTFEAEVPYELKGWSESQVLTEMDQDQLEKEILDVYKRYGNILKNHKEDEWVNLIYNIEKETNHSINYFDKEKIKLRTDYFTNTFDNEDIEIKPLDKYKIVFSGDGKVVSLQSTERRGKSAFSFIENIDYQGERQKVRTSRFIYLHKPKGSNKLEIIR
ncbi:hypothetical protein [Aquimarina longa]|uniref:hypothetical protein n=1 Tax=Aquimarina longa TaxID=1080221 RepID=UPI0011E02D55|nr:hypothetical protein [Aquimarina longa]